MQQFWTHPALSYLQSTYFQHSPNMYPADYGRHYNSLPVPTESGVVHVTVDGYRSNYTAERRKECNAFLRTARKFCDQPGSRYQQAGEWTRTCQSRVVSCFAGQGMPEEISLICCLAVESKYKTIAELPQWAWVNFGMDCVGFVSTYLIALGQFKKMLKYIPKYKVVADVATSIDDIYYDNAILWANVDGGNAKVRPNPGNKSHIAIIECWEQYGSSFYVAQSAGSKKGVDYDRVYEIVQEPKSTKRDRAYWKIRQKGTYTTSKVVITKSVPLFAAGD
ncbi:hypothetical protein [Roseibium sp. SCP14]|uniref:hypothetical protein n=1 Tax=Roseibium sp. SCP14 TaxID=3141375 RepID=UPI00333D2B4B